MKKFLLLLMALIMIMSLFGAIAYANEFPDVDGSHWAHPYIDDLSTKGIINGYDDGTFRPGGTITHGEFVKLVTMACLPSYITADDLEGGFNHWAGPYVRIAETYGLVETGEINIDNVNDPITRIEMVRLVANADIIMLQHSTEFSQDVDFSDVMDLPMKDIYKLSHAVKTGLIKGYEDNTFKPENTMTRAEAATMIFRLYGRKAG